jgi:hypothetical protein
MQRRVRAGFAVTGSLVLAVIGIACGVAPEEKIVRDFFRASRLRDNATLASFAMATFDASTEGQVQDPKVLSISPERTTPLPLKQLSQAVADARAASAAFDKDKKAYQDANIDAIQRVIEAERKARPLARKDAAVQAAWNTWRADAGKHSKAISDAQRELNNAKALAELSLSQPNGPTPDVAALDGQIVEKDVTVDADVRSPEGQSTRKTLVVTLQRCVMNDGGGKSQTGRWIVTRVRAPQQQPTT